MMSYRTRIIVLIGIIILGSALRLYQLDMSAFRGDEAFSVQRWAATPLSQSLSEIASIEPHPPLTYVIFRVWGQLFGTTDEFALRMLPVLFNLLGIPAMYALAKRLSGDDTIALLAAFFWAIHPFQIWHAQDFRNYGIWAGLSVIVLWLALRVIQTTQRKPSHWLIYAIAAFISCLIFYNELLTIGVLGLYVLIMARNQPKFVIQWSVLNGVIILLTLITFVIFQGNLITGGGYGGTTGEFQIEQWWQRFIPILYFGDTLSVTLQQQFNPTTIWWGLIVTITTLMIAFVARKRPSQSMFLVLLAIVPLIMLGLISTRLAIFRPRYVLSSVPAFILIVSYCVVLLWRMPRFKVVSLALTTLWLILNVISLNNYYHDATYRKAPAWRDLITYLENNVQADDIIIQTSVDPAFGLYYENSSLTTGEFGLPANFDQPIPDIITTMEQTSAQYQTIWILGQTFPDWQNAGVVENWASDNLQLIRETSIAGLPVRQFMTWDVTADDFHSEPLAVFDAAIALQSIEILQSDFVDSLTVIIYWQPYQQTETPLTVFTQLIGDINPATGTPLWSQDDHPPQDGRVSTDLWQVDNVYRDVYHLPLLDVENGEYALWIGFYDPASADRLTLADGADAYIIEDIIIEKGAP